MALRPCPECNRQVSTKARQCPHCGSPLAGPVVDTSIGGNARSCLGCIVWPIIGFVVLVIATMCVNAV